MREAGLKTISFSGIPRVRAVFSSRRRREESDRPPCRRSTTSARCENASSQTLRLFSRPSRRGERRFPSSDAGRFSLSDALTHASAHRQPTQQNLPDILSSATSLWNSIYDPHSTKLLHKLSQSHPDLPVHILSSHYGPLLADPFGPPRAGHAKVGRILTSVVAIACLRAQGGVGPQVTSHVFGLRKAGEKGSGAELEEKVEGGEWLTTEEGAKWVIEQVDALVQFVQGPTFARAKL